jgi:hypothetical protein
MIVYIFKVRCSIEVNILEFLIHFLDLFVMLLGGKESRTYGIDLKTGRIVYECSLQGCTRDPRGPGDEMEDIFVVQVSLLKTFSPPPTIVQSKLVRLSLANLSCIA